MRPIRSASPMTEYNSWIRFRGSALDPQPYGRHNIDCQIHGLFQDAYYLCFIPHI